MSKKGSYTTTDYLDFDKTLNIALKILRYSKDYKIAFLIIVGINSGLRISDLLKLRYEDFDGEFINLNEKKTGKRRRIIINDHIRYAHSILMGKSKNKNGLIFLSNQNTIMSVQYINRKLKVLLKEKDKQVSSHSLRKTFGRRVWQNNNESDKSLILLSEIFNHSKIAITRRYLGIRQEEISDIYMNL